MAITAQQKLHLKKLIKELHSQRAPHTEFVTVYVPTGYDLIKIIQHLQEEQGTASNIKSASTRKNVQNALEKMIQHLRSIGKTPPNGLAVFSGNVAAGEGKQDVRVWSIEPPVPLNTRIYRCDKLFVTDLIEEMLVEHNVYGLVVLDRRDAVIALLKGKTIVPLKKTHSEVPGKFKAGGQCQAPGTLVNININDTKKIEDLKVGEEVLTLNFNTNRLEKSKILDWWQVEKELLFEIKTENGHNSCSADHVFFVKKNDQVHQIPAKELSIGDTLFYVNNEVKEEKISEISKKEEKHQLIDISVQNENFIANGLIVHNSAQRFARQREGAKKDHFKKICEHMKEQLLSLGNNLKGIILGGPGTTVNDFINKDYLTGDLKKKIIGTKDLSYTGDFGLQELLDKSQDLLADEEVAIEKKIMSRFFKQMLDNHRKVTYGEAATIKALEMNAVDTLLLSEAMNEDKIFDFEEKAQEGGSEVKIISTETREGVQLRDLGGIAAILRFEVE